jgi:hypothetical protein
MDALAIGIGDALPRQVNERALCRAEFAHRLTPAIAQYRNRARSQLEPRSGQWHPNIRSADPRVRFGGVVEGKFCGMHQPVVARVQLAIVPYGAHPTS